jgi:hypothetical protein
VSSYLTGSVNYTDNKYFYLPVNQNTTCEFALLLNKTQGNVVVYLTVKGIILKLDITPLEVTVTATNMRHEVDDLAHLLVIADKLGS